MGNLGGRDWNIWMRRHNLLLPQTNETQNITIFGQVVFSLNKGGLSIRQMKMTKVGGHFFQLIEFSLDWWKWPKLFFVKKAWGGGSLNLQILHYTFILPDINDIVHSSKLVHFLCAINNTQSLFVLYSVS